MAQPARRPGRAGFPAEEAQGSQSTEGGAPAVLAGLADPFPLYAGLRSADPVAWVEVPGGGGSWMVTRFRDVQHVLTSGSFSSDPDVSGSSGGRPGPLSRVMTSCDGPRHTALRASVQRYFGAPAVSALRPRIQAVADQLIDAVAPSGQMDLADDYAFPLPMTIILEMLGLPLEDAALFRWWSRVLIDADREMTAPETAERSRVAGHDVVAYLTAALDDHRRHPRQDLISGLLDQDLDDADLVGLVWLVLTDGFESVGSFLGNAVVALLGDPGRPIERLRAAPDLLGPAVEELLRYDSPAETVRRYARQDLELGGKRIAAGEPITVVLTSANRDEARFEQPDAIHLDRRGPGHLAFGAGAHACFGAHLARAECQIGLATLLRRLPRLRLAVPPGELVWRPSLMLRGLTRIPVRF